LMGDGRRQLGYQVAKLNFMSFLAVMSGPS